MPREERWHLVRWTPANDAARTALSNFHFPPSVSLKDRGGGGRISDHSDRKASRRHKMAKWFCTEQHYQDRPVCDVYTRSGEIFLEEIVLAAACVTICAKRMRTRSLRCLDSLCHSIHTNNSWTSYIYCLKLI